MFGALRQSVKTVAVAAAAFAGVGAAAFAEATSTPGKEGDYFVDLADGGYEIGYKGRDGKQVVEIYNKSGPALYVGPPNAKAATGIGGDELTDEERVLLAQIKASVDAIVKASKAN